MHLLILNVSKNCIAPIDITRERAIFLLAIQISRE